MTSGCRRAAIPPPNYRVVTSVLPPLSSNAICAAVIRGTSTYRPQYDIFRFLSVEHSQFDDDRFASLPPTTGGDELGTFTNYASDLTGILPTMAVTDVTMLFARVCYDVILRDVMTLADVGTGDNQRCD